MTLTRRALAMGRHCRLSPSAARAAADSPSEITMRDQGWRTIWFDPVGLSIEPGETLRLTGWRQFHTRPPIRPISTAYRSRIPAGAKGWDSDYLNPEQAFEIILEVPGVYDFYCRPLSMGMVGGSSGALKIRREWEQNETGDLPRTPRLSLSRTSCRWSRCRAW
jgi:plastocyanin